MKLMLSPIARHSEAGHGQMVIKIAIRFVFVFVIIVIIVQIRLVISFRFGKTIVVRLLPTYEPWASIRRSAFRVGGGWHFRFAGRG